MEARQLLASFTVTTTADGGPGSLRAAITASNLPHAGVDNIDFAIPASTAPLLNIPVPGFDPITQTWTISLASPLPAIAHQVTIDGYTQGLAGVEYRYPLQLTPTVLTPIAITSTPNTIDALDGNNAVPRVIVDGSATGGATGFVLDASHSILRGLIVTGFGVGVSVPNPGDVGVLIQGNDIGNYPVFLVDPVTGLPLTGSNREVLFPRDAQGDLLPGNSLQGILLGSTNTTVGGVGGSEAQDGNVIIGNGFIVSNGIRTSDGAQGVAIMAGAHGNKIFGNQIGIIGPPVANGIYFVVPNGGDGVLIADSSNDVGGATAGAGNLISGNLGDGVHILGPDSTSNNVIGNYIGAGPGGGLLFGSADTGNLLDGVRIENARDNLVGGALAADRNVISGNSGAGVRIYGASSLRNRVLGNYIGITKDGISALGNGQEGVAISSADNTVGAGNVISANLRGVLLTGPDATGNLVQDNLIGTNALGTADLGNALEGVRVDGAPLNTISGNAKGSQVISGNNVGLLIIGGGATGNLALGNFIGTDVTGTIDLGNSQEGVRIEDAAGNSIGGPSATARNLISANHTGLTITGPGAVGNVVQGNAIGTGITGTEVLGNEIDGVFINRGASVNLIGGPTAASGNAIAFNRRDGVRIEDASVSDAILSNSIFANLGLGIDLVAPGPNRDPRVPTLTGVATGIQSTIISGVLAGTPGAAFTIQLFASSPLDPTGIGEGGQFLGQVVAVAGLDGVARFSANVPATLAAGQVVTATATDTLGDTSEFSNPLAEAFGTVQFQMAGYVVDEGVGLATIVATRMGGSGGLFTVDYATADGTARAGADYQPASGTLTFDPGVLSRTFTVAIIDNGLAKGDESLLLNLGNPKGPVALGVPSTAVLTILGSRPGTLQFQAGVDAVEQAAGVAVVTVTRAVGTATATVDYSTAGGTALPGVDYLPTSGTLTFGPGQMSRTFAVPILINPSIKGNVTVGLFLANPTDGSTLGAPSTAVLVIQPGLLQFAAAVNLVGEAGGSATIAVSRVGSVGTATVNYSTADGSARAGIDYLPTSGTLVFDPDVQVATFTIPILINPLIRGDETVLLNLSSPTGGAILGTPSTAALVIIDDGVDRMGPHVTSATATAGPYGIAKVVVGFDEPLNPATAVDLLNYGYSVRAAGKDGKLGTPDDKLVGLCPATYDPTALTVTLPLAVAVPGGTKLLLMINQATDVAGQGVGVSDLLGNLLDGNDDGHPGGPFSTVVVAQPASTTGKSVAKSAKHPVKVAHAHPKARAPARAKAPAPHR